MQDRRTTWRRAAVALGVLLCAAWWMSPEPGFDPPAQVDAPLAVARPPARSAPRAPALAPPAAPHEEAAGFALTCWLPEEATQIIREVVLRKEWSEPRFVAVDEDGRFELRVGAEEGEARLDVPGFSSTTLRWSMGDAGLDCELDPIQLRTAVSGLVRATEGIADGRIRVLGCGHRTRVDQDGGFFIEVDPEPCTLRAMRQDGAFMLSSPPVEVDPTSGDEVILDMNLPPWRAAGVGVSLEESDAGFVITRVVEGGPASRAGLRRGDMVVALDDLDAAALDMRSFIDLALGREGTEVTYHVLRGDQEVPLTILREPIDEPQW